MNISIVVVAWRSRDLLASCLESLANHAPDCPVVVVDNASHDGTPDMVRRRFPAALLVESPRNVGFAAGCNLGAARADGNLILFLNPDARATDGALQTLAAALLADETAAAAGGLLLDGDELPQPRYAPRRLPTRGDLVRNVLLGERPVRDHVTSGRPLPVGQVAGACLMVRREDFRRLHGFDDTFRPVFFEDVDLCRRLQLAGRRILHVPEAVFVHEGAASVSHLPPSILYTAWFDNMARYAAKHHGAGAALLLRLLTIPGALLRLSGALLGRDAGRGPRLPRAGAFLKIALRNISPWHPASQSTS